MNKIYKDDQDNYEPLVTVKIIKQTPNFPGYWVAESNSTQCQKDVNDILKRRTYLGESDVQRICDEMTRHGFGSQEGEGRKYLTVTITQNATLHQSKQLYLNTLKQ